MKESNSNRSFQYYSSIEPKAIDWIWYPYIPCGKLTLVQGDPGEGKSTFMIRLISILTNGMDFPDGYAVSSIYVGDGGFR